MLSFGQHTEGAHNVTFCTLQLLNPQVCVCGGEDSGGHVCHTPGPMTDPLCPLSLPSLTHQTRTGVLEALHIPVILEVLKQAASRRKEKEGRWSGQCGCFQEPAGVYWGVRWPKRRV